MPMGFLQRIGDFIMGTNTASKGLSIDLGHGLSITHNGKPLRPSSYNKKQLRDFADRNIFVRTAIKIRKDQIAHADWRLVRIDDPNADPDEKVVKKVRDLFAQVNPKGESFGYLLEQVIEDMLVLDAGCIEKERTKDGRLCYLWAVDGATIEIDGNWDGRNPNEPRYYQVLNYDTEKRPILNDQLIYLQQNPSTHRVYGLSQVQTLVDVINAELNAQQYMADQVLKIAPAGALFYGANVTQEQLDADRTRLVEQILGNETLLLMGGNDNMRYQPFSPSNKDQQMMEQNVWWAKKVAAAFQMDLMAFGIVEDVNKSSGEVGQVKADEGHIALAKRIASFITKEILSEVAPGYKFIFTDLTKRDALAQAEIDEIYTNIGATYPNELRKRDGKKPVSWGANPWGPNGPIDPNGPPPSAPPFDGSTAGKSFFAQRHFDSPRMPSENGHYLND